MTHRQARPGRLPSATSVLAVCAHPDDETFGLGAVLGRLRADGARVSLLCLTHGEASTLGANGELAGGDLAAVRAAELRAAATVLGAEGVDLLDHPDGGLAAVPLEVLAGEVAAAARSARADLVVVFDEGGVTGHPDHGRATQAALTGAPDLPVLAWTIPRRIAQALNDELGTSFVGRDEAEVDLVVAVDRERQRQAIACHATQSTDNPVLNRRLDLLGDEEWLHWLRPPGASRQPEVTRSRAPRRRSPRSEGQS